MEEVKSATASLPLLPPFLSEVPVTPVGAHSVLGIIMSLVLLIFSNPLACYFYQMNPNKTKRERKRRKNEMQP